MPSNHIVLLLTSSISIARTTNIGEYEQNQGNGERQSLFFVFSKFVLCFSWQSKKLCLEKQKLKTIKAQLTTIYPAFGICERFSCNIPKCPFLKNFPKVFPLQKKPYAAVQFLLAVLKIYTHPSIQVNHLNNLSVSHFLKANIGGKR